MKIKSKISLRLIIVSLLFVIATVFIQRSYIAIVGNVCEKTNENPNGYCYDKLPMKGFPIVYIKDKPGVSVQGSIGFEDVIIWRFIIGFTANWIVFFLILYLLYRKFEEPQV